MDHPNKDIYENDIRNIENSRNILDGKYRTHLNLDLQSNPVMLQQMFERNRRFNTGSYRSHL